MNPIFQIMNMSNKPNNNNNFLARFQQFRQNFTGDPRQQVEQMLQSGKVSQEQYNRAVQLANQFRNMM